MEFRFLHLVRPYRFEPPYDGEFVLLLTISDSTTTSKVRHGVSRSIAGSRCRFVLSHGIECERWHDSIDAAYLAAHPEEDEDLLMTTWHEDESLQDVLEFMLRCTSIDSSDPTAFAIVELGGDGTKLVEAKALLARLSPGS